MEANKNTTIWSLYKDYINSLKEGSIITRKGLIEYYKNMGVKFSVQTVDYMRNLSEKLGYIQKGRRIGYFVVKSKFPELYSLRDMRSDYEDLLGSLGSLSNMVIEDNKCCN